MAKTITIRIEDNVYDLFKTAADGDRRTISNFIEYATLAYLTNDVYVSDEEMNEILNDKDLVNSIKSGKADYKKGKYKIID
ncbi:MAG: CopG family transcriptional regulator [Spirochaetaceae bacterium]|nr:MAG: CopG family transcriptional regulator [Spirochaetaceae bacterium]